MSLFRRSLPWLSTGCLWLLAIGGLPASEEEAAADGARAVFGRRVEELEASGPPWAPHDLDALLNLALLDLDRLTTEPSFRSRQARISGELLTAVASPRLRDELLRRLNRLPSVDFRTSEVVEVAWGAAARASVDRQAAGEDRRPSFPADGEGSIRASIFSLPEAFFEPFEVERFLTALSRTAPQRRLIALSDGMAGMAPGVTRLETFGRRFSPWPRDPFRFAWNAPGELLVVVRPNLQRGREEDAFLGLELIQGLPPELDEAWGRPLWQRSPVPFHNGQLLLTQKTAWISLHTLEPRILELLEIERVPVASFAATEGIDQYLTAAQQAAGELADLLGRPTAFVHPLATVGTRSERSSLMQLLGGGAGFDLDSILTLLPLPDGRLFALVGDLTAGVELLPNLPESDWQVFGTGFDLAPSPADLPPAIALAQELPRARGLDNFLDHIAVHLDSLQVQVDRLPLLLLPTSLLRDRRGVDHDDFLVTWNNVVLDRRDSEMHAEGFGSLLAGGDLRAVESFALAGYQLDLLPPLVRSVVLNGGYRCASNHVRSLD